MIKLFGILDIITGIILILLFYFNITFAWVFLIYFLIKALIFFSLISIVDIIASLIFILALFNIHNVFTIIAAVWIIQ